MAMELFKIFGRIALNGVDVVNDQLGTTTNNAGKSSNKMVSAFKKIGTAVATYFAIDKIKDFGKACVSAAADVAAENAAFEQIMGDYAQEAQAKLDKVASATGITSSRMTGYMTSLSAKFKGLGYGVEDATSLAARGMNLVADGAAFWDMSLDETTSHLNSFINGSYEGGEAIGLFANDTQMALYAVEQGVIDDTKAWSSLDEATKQATRLEYAENMYALSGATGQAAKESDAYLNVQGELTEAWRQFKAAVGEPILENFVIPAMQKLANEVIPFLQEKVIVIIDWIKEAYNWYKENEVVINAVAIAIGVLVAGLGTLQIIETVKTWIMGMKAAMLALNVTMAANPIAIVVIALAALTAAFVYLWNNCEEFRNFWIGLWNDISSWCKQAGEDISNWFKGAWEDVSTWFMNAWNDMSSWFQTAWVDVSTWFSGAWNSISEWFKAAWESISTWFTGAVQSVTDWFKTAWEDVSNFFTSLWEGLKSFFGAVWDGIVWVIQVAIAAIGSILQAAFDIIMLPFRFLWENCKEYVYIAWDWIEEKINTVVTAIGEFIDVAFTAISEFLGTIWDGISYGVSVAWDWISEKISTVANAVSEFVTNAFNALSEFVTTCWNGISEGISVAWDWISEKVTEGVNAVSEVVNTVFTAVSEFVTTCWDGISNGISVAWEAIKEFVSSAINSVSETVTNIFNSVSSFVSDTWNNIKSSIESPINDAKDTVTSVVDGIKSGVTEAFDGIKNKATEVWDSIKSAIQNPIEDAKNFVGNAIDSIKGFFNFEFKWPKLTLPHFSFSGSWNPFDWPDQFPSLGIEWYAKGGVLNSPTLFGISPSGNAMVGGEDGAEAVAPIDTLMSYVSAAVRNETDDLNYNIQKLISMLSDYMPQIVNGMDRPLVLDTGAIVGGIARNMDGKLGDINRMKGRGN